MSSVKKIHLFFISLLQFEGVTLQPVFLYRYSKPGQNTSLSCDRLKHHDPSCSVVNWLYWRNPDPSIKLVTEGKIENSPGSSRLTLNSDCSLTVHNISEEDSGEYTCHLDSITYYTVVHLSVLTVSPAPSGPEQGVLLTLQCVLWRHSGAQCREDGLRWLDQNGTILSGHNFRTILSGHNFRQTHCVSNLTVERPSQHNRTYTCQYMDVLNMIRISTDYSLEVIIKGDSVPRVNPGLLDHKYIYTLAAGLSLLVLLVVAVVLYFKIKSRKNFAQTVEETEDDPKCIDPDTDPETGVTYAMINHHRSTVNHQPVAVEESVTYSAVTIKTTGLDHSAIYSNIRDIT